MNIDKENSSQTQETQSRGDIRERGWRPQHRAAAIVRLERLERAVAKHDEILSRINALLDITARKNTN